MFRVRVPATSANLGPGFDCLGLAVSLFLEVTAELSSEDHFFYSGEGSLPDSPNNLMHEGFRAAFERVGEVAPCVTFRVSNPIPLARGLGSSSAALVAGVALADAFLDGRLGREDVFQLTAEKEGHPDNVAPAVFGGFTASVFADGSYVCESLGVPEGWELLFGVPSFELLTSEARGVLPTVYSRDDVVFNASRAALWGLAVTKDKPELLRFASEDKVHEPFRAPLVPNLIETKAKLMKVGAYAAFLSGAGPTLGVVCSATKLELCKALLTEFVGESGRVLHLRSSVGYSFI